MPEDGGGFACPSNALASPDPESFTYGKKESRLEICVSGSVIWSAGQKCGEMRANAMGRRPIAIGDINRGVYLRKGDFHVFAFRGGGGHHTFELAALAAAPVGLQPAICSSSILCQPASTLA